MISTAEFRGGAMIEIGGEPMEILEFQHVKPGKGGAFVRTKLRKLKSGNVIDKTFRAGEKLEEPDCEEREMQFLYREEAADECPRSCEPSPKLLVLRIELDVSAAGSYVTACSH